MKKIIVCLVVLNISLMSIGSDKAHAQSAAEGNMMIDGFYGYPYFWGALLKAAYTDSAGANGVTLHNTNHIGLKYEYMLSDKIGLGLEYTYASASVDYPSNGKYYNAGIRKQRIIGKMNIHFANTDKLDPYFSIGAGYKMTTVFSNEPGDNNKVKVNLIPVSLRTAIGLRYYFNDFLGLNAEIGLGGPVMLAGLSFKF